MRKFGGFGYSWDGARWTKAMHKPAAARAASDAPARAPQTAMTVTVELGFVKVSKAYLDVIQDGIVRYFGKANIVSYEVLGDKVRMELPAKFAAKRGHERLAGS